MTLQAGQMLSHYRLAEKIGEGGMGVVWQATDTTLSRDVAIKVLPVTFAADPERLARFEREARLLASLNHTNIAAIHGLEKADGVRFLVLELVPGETLAERLVREPMSVERTLDVAGQIAEALECAHENGVIHRDLKPANIKLSPDGKVKILDFGLAKAFESESSAIASGSDLSHSPTVTTGGTRQGVILGTAAYMSPEQARGKPVDKRTDIWSFGCVLYECLTSRKIFAGETVSDTLAGILRGEADLNLLPRDTPTRVRDLLQSCLDKDPRNRLRDIGDARRELQRSLAGREWTSPNLTTEAARATAPSRPAWLLPVAFLVGAALGIALWALLFPARGNTPKARPAPLAHLSVPMPRGLQPREPRITSDGRTMVFIGITEAGQEGETTTRRLYTRRLDQETENPVQDSENVRGFTLSPDGRWIAFIAPSAPQSTRLQVSKVPVDGSTPPLVIRDWNDTWFWGLVWLPGDIIATATPAPQSLIRIPVDGHEPEEPLKIIAEAPEDIFVPTSHLAGGRGILGFVNSWGERGYQQNLFLLNSSTGHLHRLLDNAQFSAWSPFGHLVVSRHDTLLALPFDLETLQVTGGPVPITDGLRTPNPWSGAWFDLSDNGTLVALPGGLIGLDRRLAFLESGGNVVPWSEERRPFSQRLAISGDGTRLAAVVTNAQQLYEIWVSDVEEPRLSRLASEPGMDCDPHVWSPDAEHVYYHCNGDLERAGVYRRVADGSVKPELLMAQEAEGADLTPESLSKDTSLLLIRRETEGSASETLLLPVGPDAGGSRTPRVLPELADADWLRFSPDGHWVAYVSDKSGRAEAYIRRFDSDGSLGPEVPVSTSGSDGVFWSRTTGTQPFELLLWVRGVPKFYSVIVRTEPTLSISERRVAHDYTSVQPGFIFLDDLPDGRLIGIQRGIQEGDVKHVNVVLNWFEELERRLSTGE
jgi:serine/threonine-protein kinase